MSWREETTHKALIRTTTVSVNCHEYATWTLHYCHVWSKEICWAGVNHSWHHDTVSANNFRGKRCSEHVVSTNTCLLRFTGKLRRRLSSQKYLERLQAYNRSGTFLHPNSTENILVCHKEKLSRLLVGVFGNFSLWHCINGSYCAEGTLTSLTSHKDVGLLLNNNEWPDLKI